MFERRKRRKQIERAELLTETTEDGAVVKVIGDVHQLDTPMFAPASGRIAVAFALEIADRFPSEPGGWQPRTPFTTVEACPFVVDSDVGRVIVASAFAELVDIPFHEIDTLSSHWRDYAESRGLSAAFVREAVVQPGQRATFVGVLERRIAEPALESGFRESRAALHLVGDFDHPLLIAPAE